MSLAPSFVWRSKAGGTIRALTNREDIPRVVWNNAIIQQVIFPQQECHQNLSPNIECRGDPPYILV